MTTLRLLNVLIAVVLVPDLTLLLFLTTYCPLMLLMLPILEKPSMFLVLVMIFLLSGEKFLLIFFSAVLCSLLVWYCFVPEILLCSRNTTVQEIQLSKHLQLNSFLQNFFFFVSVVFEKEWLHYFSLFQIGKGGNIAKTSFIHKLARLGQARLGIKGFAALCLQLSLSCIFHSTRSSIYMF